MTFARLPVACALAAAAMALQGCGLAVPRMAELDAARAVRPCRVAEVADADGAPQALAWKAPARERDLARLDDWCDEVGPAVARAGSSSSRDGAPDEPLDQLVVVSWNLHAGAANLERLVGQLRSGAFTEGRPVHRYVLLLQEATRARAPGPPAPRDPGDAGRTGRAPDIVELAARLGLSLYYAPSMRHGDPAEGAADRGNAILSTESLSELLAIELPFERQRRVAVAATIRIPMLNGAPRPVRVVSAHFENRASARGFWILAQAPRIRQAEALLASLPRGPVVLGGDFNTWFGFSDWTYRVLASALPDAAAADRRPTFGRLFRLDHLFSRPPAGWSATARRLDRRFGSDHYPILGVLRAPRSS